MQNRFRIIGGEWRSRRFTFPDNPALRPSPDRVRETLFNWLAPVIVGARCLDLYAGSGALGLEALSRAAAHVTFVDRDRATIDAIDGHLEKLRCGRATTLVMDVDAFLARRADTPFDVVFVDPPFGRGLLTPACEKLAAGGWVAAGGFAYLECEASSAPGLPPGWSLHRTGRAGQVGYHLAVTSAGASA